MSGPAAISYIIQAQEALVSFYAFQCMQRQMIDMILESRLDFRFVGNEKDRIGPYKRQCGVLIVLSASYLILPNLHVLLFKTSHLMRIRTIFKLKGCSRIIGGKGAKVNAIFNAII